MDNIDSVDHLNCESQIVKKELSGTDTTAYGSINLSKAKSNFIFAKKSPCAKSMIPAHTGIFFEMLRQNEFKKNYNLAQTAIKTHLI
jgi:hypothetical protein